MIHHWKFSYLLGRLVSPTLFMTSLAVRLRGKPPAHGVNTPVGGFGFNNTGLGSDNFGRRYGMAILLMFGYLFLVGLADCGCQEDTMTKRTKPGVVGMIEMISYVDSIMDDLYEDPDYMCEKKRRNCDKEKKSKHEQALLRAKIDLSDMENMLVNMMKIVEEKQIEVMLMGFEKQFVDHKNEGGDGRGYDRELVFSSRNRDFGLKVPKSTVMIRGREVKVESNSYAGDGYLLKPDGWRVSVPAT